MVVDRPIQYVAQLSHVREVSLLGTADLAFWTDRLAGEDLAPAVRDGKAQVLIVAAQAQFWRLRFREVSFSVLVDPPEAQLGRDAAYLLCAFNSNRFFAFCERTFFSTPYQAADIRLTPSPPAAIQVFRHGTMLCSAEMRAEQSGHISATSSQAEEVWTGPIFLPRGAGADDSSGKLFLARISGRTDRYPFLPSRDSLTVAPSSAANVLNALVDSHFAATEWLIRENATHAKSKTMERAGMPRWSPSRAGCQANG